MSEHKSLEEIMNNRKDKLEELISEKINPFPHSFKISHNIISLLENKSKYIDKNTSVAGRIISLRKMGNVTFLNIQEENNKIQIFIKKNNLKNNEYSVLVKKLDIGDIVGIKGFLFYTKTKEFSINAKSVTLLSKSLRPLPNIKEKDGKIFFAFDDKENRYRKRYLDLIINSSSTEVFKKRSLIIKNIRMFLDKKDYIEVETPILQPQYGGANARPFKTFHNTLEEDLYLRIADELYLKRLIIGGMNKVYEISKNFRNEGMDKNHNPEFTMLEFYSAYSDVYDMMKITENLVKQLYEKINKVKLDKFHQYDFYEILNRYGKNDYRNINEKTLYNELKDNGIKLSKKMNFGKLLDKAFSFYVEPNLIEPSFVLNYPLELSPLAKIKRDDKEVVERFELFIGGMEIANSFSELNDPIDQKNRLEDQNRLRELGDNEAQVVDDDFIEAMEFGMPPCGGVGIGIDRLVMLITNKTSIKDVILFPAMRQK